MKRTGKVLKVIAIVYLAITIIGGIASLSENSNKKSKLSTRYTAEREALDLVSGAVWSRMFEATTQMALLYGVGEIITIIGKDSEKKTTSDTKEELTPVSE